MRYLLLIFTLLLSVTTGTAQTVFVTSDGAVFMTAPEGWEAEEIAPNTFILTGNDVSVTIAYGDALSTARAEPLTTRIILSEPETPQTDPMLTLASLLTDSYAPDAPLDVIDLPHQRVLSFEELTSDGFSVARVHYITSSPSTGLLHAIVNGSEDSLQDFLTIWYAFDPPPAPFFTCDAVTLGAYTTMPGTILEVTGILVGLDDFTMQATDGINEPLPIPIFAYPDATYMITPLAPDFSLAGGDIQLELTHKGTVCHTIDFNVLPMAAAPGELERLDAAIRRDLEAGMAFFGIQSADLTGDDIPVELYPFLEVQFMIDDANNSNSVNNLADTLEPDVLELVEAIIANDHLVEIFNSRADFVGGEPTLAEQIALSGEQYISANLEPLRQPNAIDIIRRVPIRNAQQLSYWMRFQNFAETKGKQFAGPGGAAGLSISATGFMTNLAFTAGRLSQAAVTKAGAAGAAIGFGLFTLGTIIDFYKHMLPSEITRLHYELQTTEITHEDDATIYELIYVAVDVKSKKWDLTKTVLDGLLGMTGIKGAVDGLKTANTAVQATQSLYGVATDTAMASTDLTSNICGVSGASCLPEVISIDAYEWKNINLQVKQNGGLFVNFTYATDSPKPDAVDIVQGASFGYVYTGANPGFSIVSVQPKPEAFGGENIRREQVITVEPINVDITLEPQRALPGDEVCAIAVVENALDTTLEWELRDRNNMLLRDKIRTRHGESHVFCFVMPEADDNQINTVTDESNCKERDRAVFSVTATSTTNTGAREFSREERFDINYAYYDVEREICEGMWRVTAFDEDRELCIANPPINNAQMPNLDAAFNDVIISGKLDSNIHIEEGQTGETKVITDASGQTQTVRRVRNSTTPEDFRILIRPITIESYPQAQRIASERGTYHVVELQQDDVIWQDEHYQISYPAPNTPMMTSRSDIVVDLVFVSPTRFLGRVSWLVEFSINAPNINSLVTCDIDVMYVGISLSQQE